MFFASSLVESLITKISCRSHRPVYEFIKLITQRLQFIEFFLATEYADIKECAVTKELCIHSLPVDSVCNLLNQVYI